MSDQQPLTIPQSVVRSSIQIFVALKDSSEPHGFGSSCILFHRMMYFLVLVRHVISIWIFDLRVHLNYQLNACRNSRGDKLVFFLNSVLNDCACSKPNA